RCEGIAQDKLGLKRHRSGPPPAPEPPPHTNLRPGELPTADLRPRRTTITFYLADRSVLPPEGVKVDLSDMRPSFQKEFSLPDDCESLDEFVGYYQRDTIWQNNVEYAALVSSERFCRKWRTLTRNP